MQVYHRVIPLLLISCSLLLSACGGGGGGSSSPTTTPTPKPVNSAPTSSSAGFAVSASVVAPGSFGGSPKVDDPDLWDTFTVSQLSSPTNGTVTLENSKFKYLVNVSTFNGTDSFTYTVTDSANNSITGTALVKIYNDTNYARCITPSTVNTDGTIGTRITAGPCAFYGEVITRKDSAGNPVTVKYIAHRPKDGRDPKAVVFMIGGGDLNMNITGTAATGAITTTGGNFLIRAAQLLADSNDPAIAGNLVIAMDRPSDLAAAASVVGVDSYAVSDAYRISVNHAIDILAVTHQVNTDNLPLYLSGTSRGAISVVAQNLIANGIAISSPVTTDPVVNRLHVGITGYPTLQANYIQRPSYIIWHDSDACLLSPPANTSDIVTALTNIGVPVSQYIASGGTPVTTATATVPVDECGAFHYHGYMGIEPTVMGDAVNILNVAYTSSFGTGNHMPNAAFFNTTTAKNTALQLDLTTITQDPDNNTLQYDLTSFQSSLGGSISMNGSKITYTPPTGVSNTTDYLVYVVTDSNQAVNAAVITIQIGN